MFQNVVGELAERIHATLLTQKDERVMFYMRLYTHLVQAEALLIHRPGRVKEHIGKVLKDCSESRLRGERRYVLRISDLIKRTRTRLSRVENSYSIRADLMTAQSICLLRILSLVRHPLP